MSDETPPVRAAGPSVELRRARARRAVMVLAICVGLPTVGAVVYYAGIATPEFESVTVVAIESGEPPEEGGRGTRAKGVMADHNLQIARDHMLSRDVLGALAKRHGLTAHYRAADFVSRLGAGAGSEGAFEYYRTKVFVGPETKSATLELHVKAFSGKKAHDFSAAIVAETAALFDRLSEQTRQDTLARAERSVAQARARLAAAGTEGFEAEVARQEMAAALRARELADGEAARRRRTLVAIAGPSTPDRASYPRRGWSIATVVVASLVGTGILWLLGAAVREHSRFS